MNFPLVDKDMLPWLRLIHGVFNFTMAALFFYTATLGLKIRRTGKSKGEKPVAAIRRHRRIGPMLAFFGVLGFGSGIFLIMIDKGDVLKYPGHLLVGAAIATLIVMTFLVSRKIVGPATFFRNVHFFLGVTILTLYVLEVFLGLGVLF